MSPSEALRIVMDLAKRHHTALTTVPISDAEAFRIQEAFDICRRGVERLEALSGQDVERILQVERDIRFLRDALHAKEQRFATLEHGLAASDRRVSQLEREVRDLKDALATTGRHSIVISRLTVTGVNSR